MLLSNDSLDTYNLTNSCLTKDFNLSQNSLHSGSGNSNNKSFAKSI